MDREDLFWFEYLARQEEEAKRKNIKSIIFSLWAFLLDDSQDDYWEYMLKKAANQEIFKHSLNIFLLLAIVLGTKHETYMSRSIAVYAIIWICISFYCLLTLLVVKRDLLNFFGVSPKEAWKNVGRTILMIIYFMFAARLSRDFLVKHSCPDEEAGVTMSIIFLSCGQALMFVTLPFPMPWPVLHFGGVLFFELYRLESYFGCAPMEGPSWLVSTFRDAVIFVFASCFLTSVLFQTSSQHIFQHRQRMNLTKASKLQFLRWISSEMKSPLQYIILPASHLLEMVDTSDTIPNLRLRKKIDRVVQGSHAINLIANNMLLLSRIDEGRFSFRASERISIRSLTSSLLRQYSSQGILSFLQIDYAVDRVLSDKHCVTVLISNLYHWARFVVDTHNAVNLAWRKRNRVGSNDSLGNGNGMLGDDVVPELQPMKLKFELMPAPCGSLAPKYLVISLNYSQSSITDGSEKQPQRINMRSNDSGFGSQFAQPMGAKSAILLTCKGIAQCYGGTFSWEEGRIECSICCNSIGASAMSVNREESVYSSLFVNGPEESHDMKQSARLWRGGADKCRICVISSDLSHLFAINSILRQIGVKNSVHHSVSASMSPDLNLDFLDLTGENLDKFDVFVTSLPAICQMLHRIDGNHRSIILFSSECEYLGEDVLTICDVVVPLPSLPADIEKLVLWMSHPTRGRPITTVLDSKQVSRSNRSPIFSHCLTWSKHVVSSLTSMLGFSTILSQNASFVDQPLSVKTLGSDFKVSKTDRLFGMPLFKTASIENTYLKWKHLNPLTGSQFLKHHIVLSDLHVVLCVCLLFHISSFASSSFHNLFLASFVMDILALGLILSRHILYEKCAEQTSFLFILIRYCFVFVFISMSLLQCVFLFIDWDGDSFYFSFIPIQSTSLSAAQLMQMNFGAYSAVSLIPQSVLLFAFILTCNSQILPWPWCTLLQMLFSLSALNYFWYVFGRSFSVEESKINYVLFLVITMQSLITSVYFEIFKRKEYQSLRTSSSGNHFVETCVTACCKDSIMPLQSILDCHKGILVEILVEIIKSKVFPVDAKLLSVLSSMHKGFLLTREVCIEMNFKNELEFCRRIKLDFSESVLLRLEISNLIHTYISSEELGIKVYLDVKPGLECIRTDLRVLHVVLVNALAQCLANLRRRQSMHSSSLSGVAKEIVITVSPFDKMAAYKFSDVRLMLVKVLDTGVFAGDEETSTFSRTICQQVLSHCCVEGTEFLNGSVESEYYGCGQVLTVPYMLSSKTYMVSQISQRCRLGLCQIFPREIKVRGEKGNSWDQPDSDLGGWNGAGRIDPVQLWLEPPHIQLLRVKLYSSSDSLSIDSSVQSLVLQDYEDESFSEKFPGKSSTISPAKPVRTKERHRKRLVILWEDSLKDDKFKRNLMLNFELHGWLCDSFPDIRAFEGNSLLSTVDCILILEEGADEATTAASLLKLFEKSVNRALHLRAMGFEMVIAGLFNSCNPHSWKCSACYDAIVLKPVVNAVMDELVIKCQLRRLELILKMCRGFTLSENDLSQN